LLLINRNLQIYASYCGTDGGATRRVLHNRGVNWKGRENYRRACLAFYDYRLVSVLMMSTLRA